MTVSLRTKSEIPRVSKALHILTPCSSGLLATTFFFQTDLCPYCPPRRSCDIQDTFLPLQPLWEEPFLNICISSLNFYLSSNITLLQRSVLPTPTTRAPVLTSPFFPSWLILILLIIVAIFYHFRIVLPTALLIERLSNGGITTLYHPDGFSALQTDPSK